jgi:hypothetical protein
MNETTANNVTENELTKGMTANDNLEMKRLQNKETPR